MYDINWKIGIFQQSFKGYIVSLMFHFYIPWKHLKTKCFMFLEGIEMEHWAKMG